MLVTIPHFGNAYLAAKALFDGLGIPYIIPDANNKKSLQAGSFYSPEEMCLPFKLMMGNYMQAIEKGADTIIITGSCGPCRFGEYCELQMKTLKNMGHKLDFVVIDASSEIGRKEFLRRIGIISKESSLSRIKKLEILRCSLQIMDYMDKIEAAVHYMAGYEVNKGECKRFLQSCKTDAYKCTDPFEMRNLLKEALKKLDSLPLDFTKDPLKVAVIGEIYTVIEPFSNLFTEDILMDLGVCSKRHLTPSWWFRDQVLKHFKINSIDLRLASREYLPLYIGGHGRECIGEAVLAKREGMDGAIQIFPLGCMPEIVSKAILPTIQRDKDLPIMTLIVDEMTGEAGYITRIEAFLDMLKMKRNTKKNLLKGGRPLAQ